MFWAVDVTTALLPLRSAGMEALGAGTPLFSPPCSMPLSSGFVGPHELLLTVRALWCGVRCGQWSPEPGRRCLCCC